MQIKKTQTGGIMGMKNLGKRTGTTDANITNRIQEMKRRISGIKDMIEDIDTSIKENVKSKKFLTQNIQEIWYTNPNKLTETNRMDSKIRSIILLYTTNILQENRHKKQDALAILITSKIYFQPKLIKRDGEGYFILIKGIML